MRLTSREVWWTKFRGVLGTESWLQATPEKYGCFMGRKEPHLFFIPPVPQFLLQPLVFSCSAVLASNLTAWYSVFVGDTLTSCLPEGTQRHSG